MERPPPIFRLLPEFLIGETEYLHRAANTCYICGQTYDRENPNTPEEIPDRPDLRGPNSENSLAEWRRIWVDVNEDDSYVHSMHSVRINKNKISQHNT
jgi:hypothetical protein